MPTSGRPVLRRGPAAIAIPLLIGATGSGLMLAALVVEQWVRLPIGFPIMLGGAAVVGFLVDNPGNVAIALAGLLAPIGIASIGILGQVPVLAIPIGAFTLGAGVGGLFFGLIFGMIVGRRFAVPAFGDRPAIGVLGLFATASVAAWLLVAGLQRGDLLV